MDAAGRSSVLRDPLWIFILAGLGLFALNALLTPKAEHGEAVTEVPSPFASTIEITAEAHRQIRESSRAALGREPTEQEAKAAVDAFVRDELLYREALRLGLAERDDVVRRRLVQKMEFAANQLATRADPPSEREL